MKTPGGACLALGVITITVVQFARAQPAGGVEWQREGPSGRPGALTRFAGEEVKDAGVGNVHPIDSDDEEVEQDLVSVLEANGHTTGETTDVLLPGRSDRAASCLAVTPHYAAEDTLALFRQKHCNTAL